MDIGILRQVMIGIVCNLLLIDCGMNEGWSTPIIPKFNREDPLRLTSDEIAWVVNLMYVGVGIGSIVPYLLMDRVGRKGTLLFATIPKIISWIIIGVANSFTQLYIGRIIAGIGCGITYSVMPMYLGEVTSKRTRGPLGTLLTVLLNLGMLLAYAIGLSVSRLTMAMISLSMPITFLFTFIWLPESSVFLMRKDKLASAERTLKWSLGKDDVEEELEEIRRIVGTEEQCSKISPKLPWREVSRPENRRALLIALILMSALTLTGAAPILAYQSYIYEEAGFDISTDLSIVVTGCAIVIAGSTCVLLVKRTGKRPLLMFATPVCVLALLIIASFFAFQSAGSDVSQFKWVPTVFVTIFVLGYGVALNPIPLAYIGEIFHVEMKVLGAIFSALYYALATTAVVKVYQVMQESYGTHTPILMFAAITSFIWILIYRYVPETEGKTLEEILIELRRKV